jgi:outer membrane protein TolC
MVKIPRPMAAVTAVACFLTMTGASASRLSADASSAPPPAPQPATPPSSSEPAPLSVPAKLSLKESLELALAHNATYKQSLVSVANAESRLRSTNQLNHTTFDTEIAYSRNTQGDSSTFTTFGPSIAVDRPSGSSLSGGATVPGYNDPRVAGQAGLEFTVPLLRGRGAGSDTNAQLVQARIDTDRAHLTHYDDEQGLIEAVTQAYFDAMRAQNLLSIQEEAVRIAEESTRDAQKKLDAGLIIEIELTRAQLQLSRTRGQLLSQQQQARNAIDSLVLILGLPVGASPELTDTVTYDYKPIDEAAAIQTALEHRPELTQIKLQQADADVQIVQAQTRKKTRADLRFNLASLGFTLLGGGGLTNVLTSLLGLRVSVPVKERPLQENLAQAERNRAILEDEYEFRRQQIVNEVRRLVRAAETEKNGIDLLTQQQEVDKQNLKSAQRLFEEGLGSNRDLLEAQSSQTQTDSDMLSAKVDYFLTTVNLQRAMGLPLRDYFKLPEAPAPTPTSLQALKTRGKRPLTVSALTPSSAASNSGARQP